MLAGYIVVEQILPQEVPMVVVNMVKPLFTGLQVAVAGEYEPVALIVNERFLLTTGQFAFDHIATAIVQVTITILVRSVVVPFNTKPDIIRALPSGGITQTRRLKQGS